MHAFTLVFLVALALSTLTRLWLSLRHIAHVTAKRDALPAEFSERVPLAAHQKAADYTAAKTRLGMLETLVSVALLLAFTLGGGLQLLAGLAERLFEGGGYAHGITLIVLVVLVSSIIDLPFGLYRTFSIEARFGFNRTSLRLFLADLGKAAALAALFGIPLLLLVLWLMERMGALWWLYVWAVLVGFSVFMQLVIPTFIMPWFNKFSPLEDSALVERLERLLSRCGFRSRGLFVMDGSKRSAHGNAFFAGVGGSKRIVLFDTLVARLEPAELEAVLAHELGHYKLNHIRKSLAFSFAFTLVSLAILGFVAQQPWFYEGLGVQSQTLPIALLLFLLVSSEFSFFLHPLRSILSRKHEFEADQYAAKFTPSRDLVHALVKLYKDNASTLTPDPLHSAYYDSHPPAAIRIARLEQLAEA